MYLQKYKYIRKKYLQNYIYNTCSWTEAPSQWIPDPSTHWLGQAIITPMFAGWFGGGDRFHAILKLQHRLIDLSVAHRVCQAGVAWAKPPSFLRAKPRWHQQAVTLVIGWINLWLFPQWSTVRPSVVFWPTKYKAHEPSFPRQTFIRLGIDRTPKEKSRQIGFC